MRSRGLIAYPVFIIASLAEWVSDAPMGVSLSPMAWLCLSLAAATEPTLRFALAAKLSDRYPLFARPSWRQLIHVPVTASLAVFALAMQAFVVARSPIIPREATSIDGWFPNVVEYILIALAAQGLRAAHTAKMAEAAREELRRDVERARRDQAEAELRALKAELNPHFLGNALQGVKPLLRRDPAAAQRVLSQLGELLRSALERSRTQETTLAEEIASLAPFIEIEQARLGGRLEVQVDIDRAVRDARVPDMLLQPLVENAVKHGLVPIGGGVVRVTARAFGAARLEIMVEDDGVALGTIGTARASERGGVGLANVRARLHELHGDTALLELGRGGIGTRVRVNLPLLDDDAESSLTPLPEPMTAKGWMRRNWPEYGASAWRIALSVGMWLFWTGNNVTANMLAAVRRGRDEMVGYAIADGLMAGTFMLVMAHTAFWAARRWPVLAKELGERSPARAVAGANLAFLAMFIVAGNAIKYAIVLAFDYRELITPDRMAHNLVASSLGIAMIYVGCIVVAHFYYPVRAMLVGRLKRHELSADLAAADRRRAEAELRALKAELNPHFIGNALTAVSVLMKSDIAGARRVLDQLTDLLSLAVHGARTPEVTLREELAALEPFLDVERLRFAGGLTVNLDVDDWALNAKLPHLILQPLVENAVKHGFALRESGGRIDVSARRAERFLELSVRDDGTGLPAAGPRRGATGLANTRARLSQLYGSEASLDLAQAGGGGTVATIRIPYRA